MELSEARKEIDRINREILELFLKRTALAGEVAAYKEKNGLPIYHADREREILLEMAKAAPEDLKLPVKQLFSTLMELSRAHQAKLLGKSGELSGRVQAAKENTASALPSLATVACQGVAGAYSQIAADKLFPLCEPVYFDTFDGVFAAVEAGECLFGILPIENSVHGTVSEVYDRMRHHRFSIVRSLKLKVEHRLLVKPGVSFEEVKSVLSHPQALGQCSRFLEGHPEIASVSCENTAMAAKQVAEGEDRTVAAIASPDCMERYGLTALPLSICNSDANFTRFICISKELKVYPGANRISVSLTLPHRPGSLNRILSGFAAAGLNLTKLENRPIPGSDFEMRFYLDLEVPSLSEEILGLLDSIAMECNDLQLLGVYREN